jgi:hypothetical protein
MTETRSASWSAWLDAYEQVYGHLPATSHVPCPRCDADALRVVFTGHADDRIGYASFWCDNCLFGIHLSRVPVPEGVEMLPYGLSPEQRAVHVPPNYEIVPPEYEDGDESAVL